MEACLEERRGRRRVLGVVGGAGPVGGEGAGGVVIVVIGANLRDDAVWPLFLVEVVVVIGVGGVGVQVDERAHV